MNDPRCACGHPQHDHRRHWGPCAACASAPQAACPAFLRGEGEPASTAPPLPPEAWDSLRGLTPAHVGWARYMRDPPAG